MSDKHHLADLQYAIMRVLWDEQEATVLRVQEALADDRDRALTTIATMLTKLEKKGVVAHRIVGRQFVYRPLISEAEVHRTMVADLTERLFQGDFSALVSHLLTEQEIDAAEIKRLKALVAQKAAEKAAKERRRGR
jgi:predicted transcriptional regulator